MPAGFPAYPQGRFPDDLPPTLFHPASPKVKATKPATTTKETDTTSIASTSTFSSTIGLIHKAKHSVKSKLPISYKDYQARKEREAAEKEEKPKAKAWTDSKTRKPKPPGYYEARQRTAEAYMVFAVTK